MKIFRKLSNGVRQDRGQPDNSPSNSNQELFTLSEKNFRLVKKQLDPILSGIFGYYALLYSQRAQLLVAEQLVVRNSIVISESKDNSDLICQFQQLPISPDSIDLAVLPGILQQSENPHQILREVERALIPEGQIVLLIANPISWLAIKSRISSWFSNSNDETKLFGRIRIADWFGLLGLQITNEIPICTDRMGANSSVTWRWFNKIRQLGCDYFASYYIIVARKKVSTLTPIRPSWRSNSKLVRPRFSEPSVNNRVDECVRQITR